MRSFIDSSPRSGWIHDYPLSHLMRLPLHSHRFLFFFISPRLADARLTACLVWMCIHFLFLHPCPLNQWKQPSVAWFKLAEHQSGGEKVHENSNLAEARKEMLTQPQISTLHSDLCHSTRRKSTGSENPVHQHTSSTVCPYNCPSLFCFFFNQPSPLLTLSEVRNESVLK